MKKSLSKFQFEIILVIVLFGFSAFFSINCHAYCAKKLNLNSPIPSGKDKMVNGKRKNLLIKNELKEDVIVGYSGFDGDGGWVRVWGYSSSNPMIVKANSELKVLTYGIGNYSLLTASNACGEQIDQSKIVNSKSMKIWEIGSKSKKANKNELSIKSFSLSLLDTNCSEGVTEKENSGGKIKFRKIPPQHCVGKQIADVETKGDPRKVWIIHDSSIPELETGKDYVVEISYINSFAGKDKERITFSVVTLDEPTADERCFPGPCRSPKPLYNFNFVVPKAKSNQSDRFIFSPPSVMKGKTLYFKLHAWGYSSDGPSHYIKFKVR